MSTRRPTLRRRRFSTRSAVSATCVSRAGSESGCSGSPGEKPSARHGSAPANPHDRSTARDDPAIEQKPATSFPAGADDLLSAVARLPPHERLVVSMCYLDGCPVAEIALALGRPVGTVTKQLSRAIERLRKRLNEVL